MCIPRVDLLEERDHSERGEFELRKERVIVLREPDKEWVLPSLAERMNLRGHETNDGVPRNWPPCYY